ncbi:MAG TPA: lytic polysaccharide monooxygenase [Pilimelia sp.]|nr:lytic polysaccharide monooxygenase [Pilimelia sp.]
MKILRRVSAAAAAAVVAAGLIAVVTATPAQAHGAMMKPGSRTYLCWQDGLTQNGQIIPKNAACGAAVNAGGTNSLYNWFGVLRSDGGGRTRGFIPDGRLCSGGNPVYSGFDIARADYPVTHLTAGGNFNWWYSNWAAHPGTFYLYVTRDSWSPTRALSWDDLEATPFLQVTNPAQTGAVGTNDGHYFWSGRLPAGKTGRHIIYSVWSRSDSQETFYNCSDVTFDGGNGEVTGVGSGTPGPGPTTPGPGPTTPGPGTSTPAPDPQPGNRACSATFAAASTWQGGFQGQVTIRNTGTSPIGGWTVGLNLGSATIQNLWNGTQTGTGSAISVRNANYNGTVAGGGSTTFGFTANGTAGTPSLTCAAS